MEFELSLVNRGDTKIQGPDQLSPLETGGTDFTELQGALNITDRFSKTQKYEKILKSFNYSQRNCALLKDSSHQHIKPNTLHELPQDIIAKMSQNLAISVQQNANCNTGYFQLVLTIKPREVIAEDMVEVHLLVIMSSTRCKTLRNLQL